MTACRTATCGRVSAHQFGAAGCTAKTPDGNLFIDNVVILPDGRVMPIGPQSGKYPVDADGYRIPEDAS